MHHENWEFLSLFDPFYPTVFSNLCLSSDRVQDCGVGDLGLHREQSRGKLLWVPLYLLQAAPLSVTAHTCFHRCLMEPSSSSLWPQWWPRLWPTAPAAPGTPSGSSSLCAYGGSRGSSMVSWGGARGWGPQPMCPILSCQVVSSIILSPFWSNMSAA